MRRLLYWTFHKDILCRGPSHCPASPGPETPCEDCPAVRLEQALEMSHEGRLIQSANELEFALEAGVTITPDDFSGLEFRALQALKAARQAHDKEKPTI